MSSATWKFDKIPSIHHHYMGTSNAAAVVAMSMVMKAMMMMVPMVVVCFTGHPQFLVATHIIATLNDKGADDIDLDIYLC
jgi:hypothetical protein